MTDLADLLEPEYELHQLQAREDGIYAYYDVLGAEVVIGWKFGAEFPEHLEVRKAAINSYFLRSIPMADVFEVMRPHMEDWILAEAKARVGALPARVDTDATYRLAARAYVELCQLGSRHPLQRLIEWSPGTSVDTWSSRIKRARQKGMMVGRGRTAVMLGE